MPRRLGDDPLTRAKRDAAGAKSRSETASESVGEVVQSRGSYNDVFFRRRTVESYTVVASEPAEQVVEPVETREISEISEIPEIRELASLPTVRADPDLATAVETTEEVRPAPAVVTLEIAAPVAEPAAQVGAVPVADEATEGLQSAAGASNGSQDQEEPERTGGFFKRLFGRLGN